MNFLSSMPVTTTHPVSPQCNCIWDTLGGGARNWSLGAVAPLLPSLPFLDPFPSLPRPIPFHVLSRPSHFLCHLSLFHPTSLLLSLTSSPSSPPSPLPFSVPSLTPLCREAAQLEDIWGSARIIVCSSSESGAEPQPKTNLVHFSLKIGHLVAIILVIFLRINWPNFMQFKQ